MKENQVERILTRKEVLKLIGLTGLMPVLSACDKLLNTPISQDFSEETQIPSSKDTPYIKTITPSPTATLEATSTPTETPTQSPKKTATVTPTETLAPTPEGPSEFSEKYPPEWSESYTAHVGGMDIPISIGLTRWERNRPEYPISEIHIAPDMVDNYGDYFMHMCFWRYTQFMGHPDVTYDQYLQLVANGQGQVEIAAYDDARTDQTFPEVSLIDPREGFSLVYADQALDIKWSPNSLYYGTSGGRLLMVYSLLGSEVELLIYKDQTGDHKKVKEAAFAQNQIINNLSCFGFLENKCLLYNNVPQSCPVLRNPPEFRQYYNNGLLQAIIDYAEGRRPTPPTWVVEP